MEDFRKTANKGEWSELYSLYKLLADKELKVGDGSNDDIVSAVFPIISILRNSSEYVTNNYKINREQGNIIITKSSDPTSIVEIPISEFEDVSKKMLCAINQGKGASFEIPVVEKFRNRTFCPNIKSISPKTSDGGKNKSDIFIVVHDPYTGQQPNLGFSMKSQLGHPPTLGNASGLTNFAYKLTKPLNKDLVTQINSMVINRKGKNIADVKGRVDAILGNGSELVFEGIVAGKNDNTTYFENLTLIDSCMPELIGELLKEAYQSGEMRIDKLIEVLTQKNPLGFVMKKNIKPYEAKIKRLLVDISLGMVPGTPWYGVYQATGGYLIIKETGDIICYHVYNKKSFEDYLFHNVKLETPDAGRLGFGVIIEENKRQFFTLNLQIRFIK